MSLLEIIGKAHGGADFSWASLGRYLRENYIDSRGEKARMAEAAKRDAYYEGKGDQHIIELIQVAFKDLKNRRLRSDLVGRAKWNNVIKRVAHETATVYSEPATRRISGDDATYQKYLDVVGLDAALREADRKLVYHEDVWIQYRVRADKTPVIDVVSPASFWAVCDPADRTQLIAIILDEKTSDRTDAPRYRVLTAFETFLMDGECRVIQTTHQEHALKRLPGVLATTRPPSVKSRLLAETPAADLVAAHETVWFLNVLLVKESKSATKQLAVTGDTSTAALGQPSDTETEFVLPEGVTTQSIDRGMDLAQFRDNADHILERAAANHGLPPSVLHHRDSSSGAEVHLRRIPLRELRRQRIPVMRAVERSLVELQAQINAKDLPEWKFSPDGWSVDFGEVQQPLTEAEQDQVFEKRRQLGITDTQEEIMRRNPDIKTPAQAAALLALHITRETERVRMMKELMALNGSMGSQTGEPTPEENGDSADTTLPFRRRA